VGVNNTNTINNFKIPHKKITSTYLTKGVPLLYNVGIMNKTTNKTKSLNTKSHERSELAAKPLKTKKEEMTPLDAICLIAALCLGFFIASLLVAAIPGPILGLLLLLFFFFGGWMLL
jgi:hypothetical protein